MSTAPNPERTGFAGIARAVAAPVWAGLAAALTTVVPLAAPFLLPVAAARLTRALLEMASAPLALGAAAAVPAAAFVLAAVLSTKISWIAAVVSCAFIALPALGFAAAARDGRRYDRVYLVGACLTGVGVLSLLLGVEVGAGVDAARWLSDRIGAVLPEVLDTYRKGGASEATLEGAAQGLRYVRTAIEAALPGLALAGAVIYAAVVAYPLGNAAGLKTAAVAQPEFPRFSTPLGATVLFVPAGLLLALGGPGERPLALSLLAPLVALFFLRGLAILRALLDRARSGILARALAYGFVTLMPVPLVLALGGLFDEFIDFRARMAKASEDADDDI